MAAGAHESDIGSDAPTFTRKDIVTAALAGGALLGMEGLGCGGGDRAGEVREKKRGGTLRVGIVGGGAKDDLDTHLITSEISEARYHQLNEALLKRTHDFQIEPWLAEEVSSDATGSIWTIRLRPDVEFHNGKSLTVDDVIYTIRRIIDPKDPKSAAANFTPLIGPETFEKLDSRTLRLHLRQPNALLRDDLALFYSAIVPVDYDPKRPVGTGPFKFQSFIPGDRSVFVRHPNYWRSGEPFVDELIIFGFSEETTRVNALLGGQVDVINAVPARLLRVIQQNEELRVLISETGNFSEIVMRVDQAPFNDERVRLAMKLIADRPQLVRQALDGQGRVANDLYAPFDPCYASDIPQRHQDIEQARSLLQAAGHSNLRIELVTAPIGGGVVDAAQIFAEQAKEAGVTITIRTVDDNTLFGDNYTKWRFASDKWFTRTYLAQVFQSGLPTSSNNVTHFNDPEFVHLIETARVTTNEGERCELLREAQRIQHERGGELIWGFFNLLDAYSARLTGLKPHAEKSLGGFAFSELAFG